MILVTGASGQVGHALTQRLAALGEAYIAVSRPAFDFENSETIKACFEQAKPTLVINAAAYTAVDQAQTEPEKADASNHTGPLALARLCEAADIPFIHISTDYVFDGNKGTPYVESDATSPTGVYGTTKRDGEVAILATKAKAIILRTSWVYSDHGKNFAKTMLVAGQKMPVLRVVADQRGAPTAAGDLADAILKIADQINKNGWREEYRGIFHASGAGETTWYGFACAIFEDAEKQGYKPPQVQPITTDEWPTPTRRPPDSRLDCTKLEQVFGISLPKWREKAGQVVYKILQSKA